MRKLFLTLLILTFGIFLASCEEETEVPTVVEGYTLTDLEGKTETEISEIFEGIDLVIQFRYIETNDVASGEFIRYVSRAIGDVIPFGSTLRIEIATPVPSAPVIHGADAISVFVSVQGNPPTFDFEEGVSATDYLGNNIPWGSFLSVSGNVDFYTLGTYVVTYTAVNAGLITEVQRTITVIVPPFDTNHTDALRLTASYAGLSFINNGIGEVEVTTFTDADTTNFRDLVSGERFTVRYLGIDAPEATSKYDPWGIKAATFVRETLSGAEKIILQAEPATARTDGNGRYLAWVWYVKDGVTRLLNLELAEQAYAWVSGASSTQYGNIFTVAGAETQMTGRRVYGETDPDYDYSMEGTPIEIGALIDNFATYVGKKVTITGIITSKVGNSVFIEQDGRGIYMYGGYTLTNELVIGHEVTIQGLVPAVYFEGKQLSNYSYSNMILVSTGNEVTITTILGIQIGQYVGRVVRFESLTIVSIFESSSTTDNAYTVNAKDINNTTISIRVDDYTASFLPSYLFVVGEQITVFGPVTQYLTGFQLMMPGIGNIVFE